MCRAARDVYALTLYQPWASLVADGIKTAETRSWTPPRIAIGQRIAIHAAARPVVSPWAYPMPMLSRILDEWGVGPWHLPRGAVVAVARLSAVVETDGDPLGDFGGVWEVPANWPDPFGDYSAGRYAWQLEDVHKLAEPIPATGRQRLWRWTPPDSLA